jgi:glycosyltransferase involved in cell wall biosynthesis
MKIALVCNEYPPEPHGGIGTFVYNYARELTKRGHEIWVVGVADHPRQETEDGIRIHLQRRTRRSARVVDMVRIRRGLRQAVTDGAELIEIPDYLGSLPFRFPYAPVAVRLHNTSTAVNIAFGKKPRLWNSLPEKLTLKNHRDWIGVSAYAIRSTEETFGVHPRHKAVVYNPVPKATEVASVETEGEIQILFAGTICEFKGAYRLAEAAKAIFPNFPDVQLIYAGRPIVENGIASDEKVRSIMGAFASRVQFLGFIPHTELLHLMAQSHIAVLPSSLEFGPMTVLEAMTAGLPVVVGEAGPMPEIIVDGNTGYIVPSSAPGKLVETITKLLSSGQLRKQIGSAARESVDNRFTMDACVDGSLEFYRQLLGTSTVAR